MWIYNRHYLVVHPWRWIWDEVSYSNACCHVWRDVSLCLSPSWWRKLRRSRLEVHSDINTLTRTSRTGLRQQNEDTYPLKKAHFESFRCPQDVCVLSLRIFSNSPRYDSTRTSISIPTSNPPHHRNVSSLSISILPDPPRNASSWETFSWAHRKRYILYVPDSGPRTRPWSRSRSDRTECLPVSWDECFLRYRTLPVGCWWFLISDDDDTVRENLLRLSMVQCVCVREREIHDDDGDDERWWWW